MKVSIASSLALASVFTLAASLPEASADFNAASHQAQVRAEADHAQVVVNTVKDLMQTDRALTKREELMKRDVMTDVLNGILERFRTGKIDLNGEMRQASDGLRNMLTTVNFNQAIPQAVNRAMALNPQVAALPMGAGVTQVVQTFVSGVDFNRLIAQDGINLIQGAMTQVNANAVAQAALENMIKAMAA